MTKELFLKFIILSFFVGLSCFGLLAVDKTVAKFNDIETSEDNNYSSATLNFSLSSVADFSPEITPEQNTSRTINIVKEGELDFQYKVKVENPVGELCDHLSLNDNFGTVSSLTDFESLIAIYPGKTDWNFTSVLAEDDVFLEGKTCHFEFVFRGNQIGGCYGFSDVEKIESTITAGEWNVVELLINKVYYDVDSTHGVEPKNEWIELYNPTSEPVNLKDWQICNHDSCETINANKDIPALGYAVISHDTSTWKYWDMSSTIVKINQLSGTLFDMDNNADMLVLKSPEGVIADQMNWGDYNSCDSASSTGWVKSYAEFSFAWDSVQQVADNGYVVGEGYLFKLNSEGNQVWLKDFTVSGCNDVSLTQAKETADNGYIAVAACSNSGNSVPFILKTDSNKNPLWAKTFSLSGYEAKKIKVGSIEQTFDNGYVMAGYAYKGYHDYTAFIVKTDASGNQVWGYKESRADIKATIAQQTADGGYIMAGTRPFSSMAPAETNEIFIVKFDSSGNQVWANAYGGYYYLELGSIQQTVDNGYVVVGNYNAMSKGYNALIVKIDSSGNVVQGKEYANPGATYDLFSFAQQTADGGYIIVGKYLSMSGGHTYSGLIVKTDSAFNLIWAKKYETAGATQDQLEYVGKTSDGGYIITGAAKISGNYKALLLKTDSSGNVSSCPSLQELTTLTASVASFTDRSIAALADPSIIVSFSTPSVFDPGVTLSPASLCGTGSPSCDEWPNYNSNVWEPGAVDVAEGSLLGRNPTGYDTNQASDWKEFGLPTVTITNYLGSIWYCNSTYPLKWKVENPNGPDNQLKVNLLYISDNGTKKGQIDDNDTTFLIAENLPYLTSNSGTYMFKVDSSLGYCYYGYNWVKLVVTGSENPMLNNHYISAKIFDPPAPGEGAGVCWAEFIAEEEAILKESVTTTEEEPVDEEDDPTEPIEEQTEPEEEIVEEETVEEIVIEEAVEEQNGLIFQVLPLNDDINLPGENATGSDSPEADGINN